MANYAGLSAVYPGFLAGQTAQADARLKTGQADDADITRQGQEAFGRTLLQLQQLQNPGAGQGPQPPMPGQPSMPSQPPEMPREMGGTMMPQPRPMEAPGGSYAAGGGPQAMPQPGPGLGPQPQGGGMPGGGQNITWQSVAQKVSQANPGANPRVIAAAVDKFMPIMNQQAQQQWQLMRAQIMQQESGRRQQQGDDRIAIQDDRLDLQKGAEGRRTEQGNRRLNQGDTRLQGQADERGARGERFDRREEDRATDRLLKQKKDALALELQRERNAIFAGQAGLSTDQLKKRLDEAQQRHEKRVGELDEQFKPVTKQKPTASVAKPAAAARTPAAASFDDRFGTDRNIVSDGKGNFLEYDGKAWVPVQQ